MRETPVVPAVGDILLGTIRSLYIFRHVVTATSVLYILIVGPSDMAIPDVCASGCAAKRMFQ